VFNIRATVKEKLASNWFDPWKARADYNLGLNGLEIISD